jgi:TrmH family RNA methyltransferase
MANTVGRSNSKIRLARSLRQRKARQAEKLFLVEGAFHIGAALEAKAVIEFVVYAEDMLDSPYAKELIHKLQQRGVKCLATTPEIFEGLSNKENPQGLLAVARQNASELSSLTASATSLIVALVAPQDPGNLGSILRTMDAAGAEALVLIDGGVDPYHPSAVRAGMGAHFTRRMAQASFADFAAWTEQHGVHVYGSSAHATGDYREVDYARPAALLLGSEREGLTQAQLAACEQVVKLPMHGKVTSLNLSVAAGILLYEMIRGFG